jgi:hypothetical protein
MGEALPGYDAWKTSAPDEPPVYQADAYIVVGVHIKASVLLTDDGSPDESDINEMVEELLRHGWYDNRNFHGDMAGTELLSTEVTGQPERVD